MANGLVYFFIYMCATFEAASTSSSYLGPKKNCFTCLHLSSRFQFFSHSISIETYEWKEVKIDNIMICIELNLKMKDFSVINEFI